MVMTMRTRSPWNLDMTPFMVNDYSVLNSIYIPSFHCNLNLLCSKQRFPVDFPLSLKPIHWTSCLEIQFQLIDRHICIFHRFAWLNHVKSQLQQASPPHVAPSSPVVPAWGLSPASPVAESEDLRLRRSVPYWGLWSALYCSNSWDGIGVFLYF